MCGVTVVQCAVDLQMIPLDSIAKQLNEVTLFAVVCRESGTAVHTTLCH